MGNSQTGRHADGRELYDSRFALPDPLAHSWNLVLDRAIGPAPGADGIVARGRPRIAVPLRKTVRIALAPSVQRAGKAAGLDPGEVALLAGTSTRETNPLRARVRILECVERQLRREAGRVLRESGRGLTEGVRLHIRTWLLEQVGRIPDAELPPARRVRSWLRSPSARARLRPGIDVRDPSGEPF